MSVCVIVNIEMTGSCLAVLAMAVVYEGLKAARQWLKEAAVNRRRSHQEDSGRETPVDDVPIILRTPSFFSGLVCWFYVMTNQCRASASTVYAISCSFISQTLALAIGVKVIFDHYLTYLRNDKIQGGSFCGKLIGSHMPFYIE